MDNASLIRAHWFERKRDARLPHAIGGEISHRLQLSFTCRAKSVNVTNEPFSAGEASSEHLIDQVLQRFEQLSGLRLQQFGVVALDVQHLATDCLLHFHTQLQARHVEDVFEKLCCLLSSLTHLLLPKEHSHRGDLKNLKAPDPVASSALAAHPSRA